MEHTYLASWNSGNGYQNRICKSDLSSETSKMQYAKQDNNEWICIWLKKFDTAADTVVLKPGVRTLYRILIERFLSINSGSPYYFTEKEIETAILETGTVGKDALAFFYKYCAISKKQLHIIEQNSNQKENKEKLPDVNAEPQVCLDSFRPIGLAQGPLRSMTSARKTTSETHPESGYFRESVQKLNFAITSPAKEIEQNPTVIGASLVKNFFLLFSFFSFDPSYSFMRTQVSVATDCLQSVILGLVTLCLVLFASYPQ